MGRISQTESYYKAARNMQLRHPGYILEFLGIDRLFEWGFEIHSRTLIVCLEERPFVQSVHSLWLNSKQGLLIRWHECVCQDTRVEKDWCHWRILPRVITVSKILFVKVSEPNGKPSSTLKRLAKQIRVFVSLIRCRSTKYISMFSFLRFRHRSKKM